MKKSWIVVIFVVLFLCFPVTVYASGNPEQIQQDTSEEIGYEGFWDAIPEHILPLLDMFGMDSPEDFSVPELSVVVKGMLSFLLECCSEYLPLFAVGILLLLLFKLLSAASVGSSGVLDAFGYLCIFSSGIYSFAVVERLLDSLCQTVESVSSFLSSATPVLISARIWSGAPNAASAMAVTLPIVYTTVSFLISSVFYPMCLFCYAGSVGGFACSGITIRPFVSSVKRFANRGLEILSALTVGVFYVQRIAASSADTMSRRSIRFAVGQMIPLASGALTEGVETVYACGQSLCEKIGVVCVFVLGTLFTLPCLSGLFLMFLYSLLSTVGTALDIPILSDFFSDMKDVFSMLSCFSICSLTVLASGVFLLIGG